VYPADLTAVKAYAERPDGALFTFMILVVILRVCVQDRHQPVRIGNALKDMIDRKDFTRRWNLFITMRSAHANEKPPD
jgi:hypothetical protein